MSTYKSSLDGSEDAILKGERHFCFQMSSDFRYYIATLPWTAQSSILLKPFYGRMRLSYLSLPRVTSEIRIVSLRPEHCIFLASLISKLHLKRSFFCNLIQEAGLERWWGGLRFWVCFFLTEQSLGVGRWQSCQIHTKDKAQFWWCIKGSFFPLNEELSHKHLNLVSMTQGVIW